MKGNLEQAHIKTDAPVTPNQARLPNERDESVDSQADAPRPDIKQAYEDMKNGQVNTELRGEQGLDAATNPGADVAPINPRDTGAAGQKKH